jgi:hypothetical protein
LGTRVDVDRSAIESVVRHAPSVDQDESGSVADAAQVDGGLIRPRQWKQLAANGHLIVERQEIRRQLAHQLGDRRRSTSFDVLPRQHLDRQLRVDTGAMNVRFTRRGPPLSRTRPAIALTLTSVLRWICQNI